MDNGHRHCDERLPHADFIGENHAWLSRESGENLRGGTLLPLTILLCYAVIAQADLRVQHPFAFENAAVT